MFAVHHVRGILYGIDEALKRLDGLGWEDINKEALEGRRSDLHQVGKQRQSDAHFAESKPRDEGRRSDGRGVMSELTDINAFAACLNGASASRFPKEGPRAPRAMSSSDAEETSSERRAPHSGIHRYEMRTYLETKFKSTIRPQEQGRTMVQNTYFHFNIIEQRDKSVTERTAHCT